MKGLDTGGRWSFFGSPQGCRGCVQEMSKGGGKDYDTFGVLFTNSESFYNIYILHLLKKKNDVYYIMGQVESLFI